MAAFAVSLDIVILHQNAYFDYKHEGLQELLILGGLGFKDGYELEPKANGCTKVSDTLFLLLIPLNRSDELVHSFILFLNV